MVKVFKREANGLPNWSRDPDAGQAELSSVDLEAAVASGAYGTVADLGDGAPCRAWTTRHGRWKPIEPKKVVALRKIIEARGLAVDALTAYPNGADSEGAAREVEKARGLIDSGVGPDWKLIQSVKRNQARDLPTRFEFKPTEDATYLIVLPGQLKVAVALDDHGTHRDRETGIEFHVCHNSYEPKTGIAIIGLHIENQGRSDVWLRPPLLACGDHRFTPDLARSEEFHAIESHAQAMSPDGIRLAHPDGKKFVYMRYVVRSEGILRDLERSIEEHGQDVLQAELHWRAVGENLSDGYTFSTGVPLSVPRPNPAIKIIT